MTRSRLPCTLAGFASGVLLAIAACGQGTIGDPPNAFSPLGMNLDAHKDWMPAWSFVDVFKHARTWIAQTTTPGNPWSTGQTIQTTPEGWPLLAPGQGAGTIMCRGLSGHYPAGQYLCLYDGSGTINFGMDAQAVSSQPGQIIVNVTPANEGIYLHIGASNPSDPIRNIRVITPGFWTTYDTQIFHPLFLERLRNYKVIRFMNWQETNTTQMQDWSERTTPTRYTQAGQNGVALEHMIQLCNRLHVDPWFCMPHRATNAFMQSFATMTLQQLDPSLKVYIEYTNEAWNGVFPQAAYCNQQGTLLGLSSSSATAGLRFYSQRSVDMFQVWSGAFGGTGRLVRVLASHAAAPFRGVEIMGWQNAHLSADALAIAPYFGGNLVGAAQAPITVTMTVAQIIAACQQSVIQGEAAIQTNHANAAANGLDLIAYEGGQHLVGIGSWQNNTTLTNLFIAANRDPGMYAVYRDYLTRWFAAGGGMFAALGFCYKPGIYGSWGSYEWQDQPLSTAHKARALEDEIASRVPVYIAPNGCGDLQTGTTGLPAIGSSSFTILLDGANPNSPVVLAGGLPGGTFAGQSLPWDLGPSGAPGCFVNVSDAFLIGAIADGAGSVSLPTAIPLDPALIGLDLHLQWGAGVTGANPLGLAVSDRIQVTIQ